MNDLAVIGDRRGPLAKLSDTARTLAAASLSANTRRAYAGALKRLDTSIGEGTLDDAALADSLASLFTEGRAPAVGSRNDCDVVRNSCDVSRSVFPFAFAVPLWGRGGALALPAPSLSGRCHCSGDGFCAEPAINAAQSLGGFPCASILANTVYGSVLLPVDRNVRSSFIHA